MIFSKEDNILMLRALYQAEISAEFGEVPVGAVMVAPDGNILAEAGNRCITDHDPSAHAETIVIRQAAAKMCNYRLPGCRLYVTLEPCLMCAGLCIQARVNEIIFGAFDPKAGALTSRYHIGSDGKLNHHFTVRGGLLANECGELLRLFFKKRR